MNVSFLFFFASFLKIPSNIVPIRKKNKNKKTQTTKKKKKTSSQFFFFTFLSYVFLSLLYFLAPLKSDMARRGK